MSILSPVERLLARRYLRARRGFISITTWFAIIGIALGVATLILVTSLMNGIRDEMTSRFIGLDGHVTIYSNARAFTDYQPAIDAIAAMPEVLKVTPKISGQVMVTAHGAALGAQATATPWESLEKNTLITSHVTSGSLEGLKETPPIAADTVAENEQNTDGTNVDVASAIDPAANAATGVVLGESLARNLRVEVGDSVTLISPQGRATIAGFIPRMKAYPVVATVKLGMHAIDSSLVILPFTEAQQYFLLSTGDGKGAISNLEVMLKDVNAASRVSSALRDKLGAGARVYDWQQTNASVFAALTVQRNVMVIILGLIILVAAFNIISSLVMLVKDKGRDIAVLRTMGGLARQRHAYFHGCRHVDWRGGHSGRRGAWAVTCGLSRAFAPSFRKSAGAGNFGREHLFPLHLANQNRSTRGGCYHCLIAAVVIPRHHLPCAPCGTPRPSGGAAL